MGATNTQYELIGKIVSCLHVGGFRALTHQALGIAQALGVRRETVSK